MIVHVSFEAVVKGFALFRFHLLMPVTGWDKIGFMWFCCGVVECGLGFVVAVEVDECADGVALWAFGFCGWPGFFAVCAVGCFLVVDE